VFQDGSGGRPTYSPQTTSATTGAQSSQRRVPNRRPPPGAFSNRVPCLPDQQLHVFPEGRRGHGSQMLPRSGGGAGSRLAITPTGAGSCNPRAQVAYQQRIPAVPRRMAADCFSQPVAASYWGGSAPDGSRCNHRTFLRIRNRRAQPTDGLNPPVRPSRAHPFASERFHVLLNSLFKVLCNFPSRYLFAIGLVEVFSLRWSLPPA